MPSSALIWQTVSHVDLSDHDAPRGWPDDRAALQGYTAPCTPSGLDDADLRDRHARGAGDHHRLALRATCGARGRGLARSRSRDRSMSEVWERPHGRPRDGQGTREMSAITTGGTAEVGGVEHNRPAGTPAHRGETIHVSR